MHQRLIILSGLIVALLSGVESSAQELALETYSDFSSFDSVYLTPPVGDSIRVINFWATWCAPCVKELPYFEQLEQELAAEKKLAVVLVTIDLKSAHKSSLYPFLRERNLKSKVVALTDSHTNEWIDNVDPRWSGAIPITVILKGEQRLFFEKAYHSVDELLTDINTLN